MAVHGLAVKTEGSPQPRNFDACTSETSSVSLVDLVCFVYLVHLVYSVGLDQPNKRDKPNKPNNVLRTLADFFSILLEE
jgi:hypothetical protein